MKITFKDIRTIKCLSLEEASKLYNIDVEILRSSEEDLEFTDKQELADILSMIGLDYDDFYSFDVIDNLMMTSTN